MVWLEILTLKIAAVMPSTNAIFAILEPTTFPKAISLLPANTACKLTNNSGAEVAKETTVIPTTKVEMRIRKDKATEPLTKNSPPKYSNVRPNKKVNAKIIN